MADTLTTITELLNKPPAQFLAGGVLAGIVWKFFRRVEGVLTDATKHEIARWLRVRNVETGIVAEDTENWPDTFANLFDRVFGKKHLSWRCFWRSCLASFAAVFITFLASGGIHAWKNDYLTAPTLAGWAVLILVINVLPDFLSLLESRLVLAMMGRTQKAVNWILLILIDFVLTFGIAFFACLVFAWLGGLFVYVYDQEPERPPLSQSIFVARKIIGSGFGAATAMWFYPAFFTSIWLWLYAGSGFLLKAARRFDIGFDWFNRRFDIERRPLSAIGLVAGAMVAVVYWAAVIVSRII
jgi:hypothetical protein